MNWFYNLKISKKLLLSFGAVLTLTLAVGIGGILFIRDVDRSASDLADNWMPSVQAVMNLRTDVGELRRLQLMHILSTDDAAMAQYEERIQARLETTKKDEARYQTLISSDEERRLFQLAREQWLLFLADHLRLIDLSRHDQKDRARAVAAGASAKGMDTIAGLLNQLVALNVDGGEAARKQAAAVSATAARTLTVLLALTIVAGLALALWIARTVSAPLEQAVALARQVAAGDLRRDIVASSRCETGQLMAALRDMTVSLRALASRVHSGSDAIAAVSGQIASGNQDLSERTEQQAGALEETASSIEQLTAAVKQNADNAHQARALAEAASHSASDGGAVMAQVVTTMAAIHGSSRQIVDIIAVIDGIAFQTNILALNAAVEAARAGAQLVEAAGGSMRRIVADIASVSGIMAEIAQASREQSQGIEQVNDAIVQMDQVTQQNAALVEEAAAAAESMREQSGQLIEVVRRFQLPDATAVPTPARPQPQPRLVPRAGAARPAALLAGG